MTNSERRISRVRAAVAAGRSAAGLAHCGGLRAAAGGEKLFPYETPEEIFNEHRETTRGATWTSPACRMRCSTSAAPSSGRFRRARPAESGSTKTAGFPRRPATRASSRPFTPVAEEVDDEFPFRLTTGRLRDQWHSMSRTGTIAGLFAHEPEPRLMVHPQDL